MATFRKTPSKRIQAIIRVKGHKPVSQTFPNIRSAKAWANTTEREIALGIYQQDMIMTLPELIDAYEDKIGRYKKSYVKTERYKYPVFKKELSCFYVHSITPKDVQAWLDSRKVKPATKKRNRALLSSIFQYGIHGLFLEIDNPVLKTKVYGKSEARDFIASEDEFERIVGHLSKGNELLCRLLLATGMRRNEAINAKPSWIQVMY